MNLILTTTHVANRNISISQLLSSRCYLFIVSNSGLLSVQRPRPASHAHFRHSYIPELISGVNSSIDFFAAMQNDEGDVSKVVARSPIGQLHVQGQGQGQGQVQWSSE